MGHLVLENSDYIIDSVCRELRHLDLNPNVPSILAAMLSYIGVAHKILPLLEEPVCFLKHIIAFYAKVLLTPIPKEKIFDNIWHLQTQLDICSPCKLKYL